MRYVTVIERMAKEQQKQEIALNMLKDNFPIDQVLRLTGLTSAQIEELQVQIK